MKLDIGQIAKMLAERAEEVCQWLLPGGQRRGQEWMVGNIFGDSGDSLRVNIGGKAGVWRDFAADERGGDLIDLIMASRGVAKSEAIKEAKAFLGITDEKMEFEPKRRQYKAPEPPKGYKTANGSVLGYFKARGISSETVKAYKIAETENAIIFPYLIDGNLKFYKCRDKREKKFWAAKDAEPVLFGWHAITENWRYVVITEGEIDAMSFYEQGQPGLSVPFGGGADDKQDKWLENEFDRLQLFDTIYLAMDMDAQGQKATEHLLRRLGRHRCKVVDFGQYKDANEALVAGERLVDYLTFARNCDPPELRSASSYVEEVVDYFCGKKDSAGYSLPWEKTNSIVRLRKSEISLWAGINGHGKSQVVGHVTVDSISRGEIWCVASMEFKPFKLLARMYRQAAGISQPTPEQCRGPLCSFFDGRLYLFDVQGTAKAERILDVFEYAFRRYGCTSFLIDSLAKCGFGEDDYNGQKSFVDRLMEFAQRNDVHVHLVAHARKQKNEEDEPGKMDIKGTGALSDMVDNVFIIWRNKKKEAAVAQGKQFVKALDEPDCILNCSKQRNGEWEGKVLLWFDRASFQYCGGKGAYARNYAISYNQ
ncbi:toprim domain-containing protein [Desulfovibrio sp. OttesenSCG-928-A18]|nr:toprim domain-containing protein [Desulfovibrio sp. OttesenSCG-928-A18]